MRTLGKLLPVMIAMALPCRAEERLIPFDQFLVSVETNDWLKRADDRDGLDVSVWMARGGSEKPGTTKVDVSCVRFDSTERDFSSEDQEVFRKAGDAAMRREVFSKEILSPTLLAKKETLFESKEIGGSWVVTVTRGSKTATFEPEEGQRLEKALEEARAGEKWFKELLHARKRPEPAPHSHPPRSKSFHMSSRLGEIAGRGIDYSVSVDNLLRNYQVQHWLSFRHGRNGSSLSSGGYSETVLKRVTDALTAVRRGVDYSFKSGDGEIDGFSVVANLERKEAELTIRTGLPAPEPATRTGYFGEAQLESIQKLLEEAQPRIEWFRENEALFFDGPDF